MNWRPKTFEDLIGQPTTIKKLKILVTASQKTGNTLPHILFDGPPGLGKTTLSQMIGNELGVNVQLANGANLRTIKTILPYLVKATRNSILFIDEIHRLTTMVEEFLYPVMEDSKLHMSDGEEITNIDLEPFTIIGATTIGGSLSRPFYDRFQIHEHLTLYSDEELSELILLNCAKLGMELSKDISIKLARRCRGTPRICNNLLQWLSSVVIAKDVTKITDDIIEESMELWGIDLNGLTVHDRVYLSVLRNTYNGGPVSLGTLSSALSMAHETIVNQVEPFLILKGFIEITTKGRRLL